MRKNWLILFYIVIFCALFIKASIFLDPDFGWHYQMGKIITESGVPKLDQFSYTMPDFLYIDHEWLIDVFIYKLYDVFGVIGLSAIWSLIALATIYISVFKINPLKNNNLKLKNYSIAHAAVFLLVSGLIILQFGIRPQVISWFLFSILLWLLTLWDKSKFIKLVTPILFFIWANLHGEFALGIVTFFIFLIIKSYKSRRLQIPDFLSFVSSFILTFVNPYGIGLWQEIFGTFFNSTLRNYIEEWRPALAGLNICYPLVMVLGVIVVFRYRKYYLLEYALVFCVLLLMSFSALINVPLFGIISTPIIISGIYLFKNEIENIKYGKDRFGKALKVFAGLTFFLFCFSSFYSIRSAIKISENIYYPKKSVAYILNNIPQGEIFSNYNWGGYLIWKIPQRKVFVDGRMAHWPNILDYQIQILTGKIDYLEVVNKYNIQMVLWTRKENTFINNLKKTGWKIVYSDNVSEVLSKN